MFNKKSVMAAAALVFVSSNAFALSDSFAFQEDFGMQENVLWQANGPSQAPVLVAPDPKAFEREDSLEAVMARQAAIENDYIKEAAVELGMSVEDARNFSTDELAAMVRENRPKGRVRRVNFARAAGIQPRGLRF